MPQKIKSRLIIFVLTIIILAAAYIFVSYKVNKRREELNQPLHPSSSLTVDEHISMANSIRFFGRGDTAALEYLDYAYEVTKGNEEIRLAIKEIECSRDSVTIKGDVYQLDTRKLSYSETQLSHNNILDISRMIFLEEL